MGKTVLAGGDAKHFLTTTPGATSPLRVWAMGDSGTANANAAAVRDVYLSYASGEPHDVWLMLGDNAYPAGTDARYQTAVFNMYSQLLRNTVLWSTVGNHDAMSATSATQSGPYDDMFSLPTAG